MIRGTGRSKRCKYTRTAELSETERLSELESPEMRATNQVKGRTFDIDSALSHYKYYQLKLLKAIGLHEVALHFTFITRL